jgi:hypothetical protein
MMDSEDTLHLGGYPHQRQYGIFDSKMATTASLVFTPDGKGLLSASWNETVIQVRLQ